MSMQTFIHKLFAGKPTNCKQKMQLQICILMISKGGTKKRRKAKKSRILWGNYHTSIMIYDFSKHFTNGFMVSISSFPS